MQELDARKMITDVIKAFLNELAGKLTFEESVEVGLTLY